MKRLVLTVGLALWVAASSASAQTRGYHATEEVVAPEVRVFSARVVEVRDANVPGFFRREMRVEDVTAIRGEVSPGLRGLAFVEPLAPDGGAPETLLPGSGREREIAAGQRWIFFTSTNTISPTWDVMRAEPAAREKEIRGVLARALADAAAAPPLVHRLPPRPDAAAAAELPEATPSSAPAPPPPSAAEPEKKRGCAGCSVGAGLALVLVPRRARRRRQGSK